MFSLVKAVALPLTTGAQWQEVDILETQVFAIFNNFTRVYLELSNPSLTKNVYVDLDVLRPEFSLFNGTLKDMLISFGDRSLPRVDSLPSTQVQFVRYSDAFKAKYRVDPVDRLRQLPASYPVEDLPDLKLTRPGFTTDMRLLHTHCLVSVNGFLHATDTDGAVAYVVDGNRCLQLSNQNLIGIHSFLDVGALTKYHFKPEDIDKEAPDSTLKERVFLTVPPEINLENKSVFLVLGGYYVPPQDGVFWQSGANSFALDIKRLMLTERIHESDGYVDLSSLKLTRSTTNPNHYLESEIYSDAAIAAYLQLSQSFLVVVDRRYMGWKHLAVHSNGIPGVFTTYQPATYPLLGSYGRVMDYWTVQEDGYWSVTVADSSYRHYVFQSIPKDQVYSSTPQMRPQLPYRRGVGHMLQISGYNDPKTLID